MRSTHKESKPSNARDGVSKTGAGSKQSAKDIDPQTAQYLTPGFADRLERHVKDAVRSATKKD